jgi:hypothetical protein
MVALGIISATIAAFVLSAVYYGSMPGGSATDMAPTRPVVAQVLVELARNAAVAVLIAGLLGIAEWSGLGNGMVLGCALWALPVVLLAGSVFHEGVPIRRAGLHAVDWLIKLVVIGAISGLFS